MSKLLQVNALENGKGIQYLLDAAYKIFHNPIAIHDTNYDLLAYTNVASDDSLWNELISTGTISMKTQEFYVKEFITEEVANADKLVLLKSSELKYDRISGYIFNRDNIKVAVITIVECHTPFGSEDLSAFEVFADKITNEIRNDNYFNTYGRAYHDAMINKLLDRVIDNTTIYMPHVQILYDGFSDYLRLAVMRVSQGNTWKGSLAYLKSLLEGKYRNFKYAIYSNYIIVIMSSKGEMISDDQFFSEPEKFLEHNNLFVGISSSFENLYYLREYYDKTVAALEDGIKNNGGRRIFFA